MPALLSSHSGDELLGRDFIAQDAILLAKVKLAIQHDRMGPTWTVAAAGDLEAAELFVFFRRGFHELHLAVFPLDIDAPIGGADGAGALAGVALAGPFDLARAKIGAVHH